MIRRLLLVALGAAALCLIPWTVYLADTLPNQFATGQWRTAWVGFDIALLSCFGAAAWLGRRRRPAAVSMLTVTAALLCCDAWFDVVLDWAGPDRWFSVFLAVCVELPIAVLLLLRAKLLLVGGMPRRLLTPQDLRLRADPAHQALLGALGELAPATPRELADVLGRPATEVTEALGTLREAGYVGKGRDGRWRGAAQTLREPKLAEFDQAYRAELAAYLDAKYDKEVQLFAWAAAHRAEFGPAGKAHRAFIHLTQAELDAFDAEYDELLTRYCLLHRGPAAGTREVAIRWYGFPTPAELAKAAKRTAGLSS